MAYRQNKTTPLRRSRGVIVASRGRAAPAALEAPGPTREDLVAALPTRWRTTLLLSALLSYVALGCVGESHRATGDSPGVIAMAEELGDEPAARDDLAQTREQRDGARVASEALAPSGTMKGRLAVQVEPEAREAAVAAEAGLARFLGAIPEVSLGGFGFGDRHEVDRAVLGAPYRVWLSEAQAREVGATDEWRFPVMVDGAFRALLTVSRVDGAYLAVDFGAAGLARELGGLERARTLPADGRRVLLRLPALRADLAAFPATGARVEEAAFEPLASARAADHRLKTTIGPRGLLPWMRARLEAVPTTR